MATTPTRPPRHPWLWFALAGVLSGLTLLLIACLALVSLGSAARRAPQPIVLAPPDPDADEVHWHWVSAMLDGDERSALELLAEPDAARRQERVQLYRSKTQAATRLAAASGLIGPYLNRHALLGSIAGDEAQQRIGLSELSFARGSLCYATRMQVVEGAWRVVEWEPAGKTCARFVDQRLPGEPPSPAAAAEAAAVHAAWAAAMFSGDVAGATPLSAEEPPQEGQSLAQIYGELTQYVLVSGVQKFGPYQGYEILEPFAESQRHQVGYARVGYERGQFCFRSDLHYRDGQWLVDKWDLVIPEACRA
ncbi:MAG: hypothetical protein HXY37_11835 [Chloroflexi bacterium]|nr:hypothetical protein [Chloroflexota bacterium]